MPAKTKSASTYRQRRLAEARKIVARVDAAYDTNKTLERLVGVLDEPTAIRVLIAAIDAGIINVCRAADPDLRGLMSCLPAELTDTDLARLWGN